MRNAKIEKLQEEILEEINNDKIKINNLKIYDSGIDKIIMKKFAENDKKYDKKFQKGQDEYMNYLITTYYLDEDQFYDMIKNLNNEDLEYLTKYLKNQDETDIKDIIDDINAKVLEKKKENR